MNTRLIDVNGSAGAYVSISATLPCIYVEIREDEAGTAQGLTYQLPGDAFATTYTVGTPSTPDAPQIKLGQVSAPHRQGPVLGWPEQNIGGSGEVRAATVLIKVRSKTGTATKVRVTEFE